MVLVVEVQCKVLEVSMQSRSKTLFCAPNATSSAIARMMFAWFAAATLFNIARVFGGKLPRKRAALAVQEVVQIPSREVVLPFPKPHRLRRRATVASRQAAVAPLDDNESDEVESGVLFGPKGR